MREHAFHVIEARDGAAAVDLLRAMNGSLEWLVTNVRVGILSGLHVAFEYRYLHPARPIVFLDDSTTPDRQDLLNGSVTLGPPFAAQMLISLMETLRSEKSQAVTIGC
jgi:DNA-binding response OmpR family regulator